MKRKSDDPWEDEFPTHPLRDAWKEVPKPDCFQWPTVLWGIALICFLIARKL